MPFLYFRLVSAGGIKHYTTPFNREDYRNRSHDQLPADLYHWIGKGGIGGRGLHNSNQIKWRLKIEKSFQKVEK